MCQHRSERCSLAARGDVDVVGRAARAVVRPPTRGQQITRRQVGLRAVEERPRVVDRAGGRGRVPQQGVETLHQGRDPGAPARHPRVAAQDVLNDGPGALGRGGQHVLRDDRVVAPAQLGRAGRMRGRPQDVADLGRLRQGMQVRRSGGGTRSVRTMPGCLAGCLLGGPIGRDGGGPLQAGAGGATGEDPGGVQGLGRSRIVRARPPEHDEDGFGTGDGVPCDRPQLVHRQLGIAGLCVHLPESRTHRPLRSAPQQRSETSAHRSERGECVNRGPIRDRPMPPSGRWRWLDRRPPSRSSSPASRFCGPEVCDRRTVRRGWELPSRRDHPLPLRRRPKVRAGPDPARRHDVDRPHRDRFDDPRHRGAVDRARSRRLRRSSRGCSPCTCSRRRCPSRSTPSSPTCSAASRSCCSASGSSCSARCCAGSRGTCRRSSRSGRSRAWVPVRSSRCR